MDFLTDFGVATERAYLGWALIFLFVTVIEISFPKEGSPIASRLSGLVFWAVWLPVTGITNFLLLELWGAIGLPPLFSVDAVHAMGWAGPFAVTGAMLIGLLVADFFAYWYHRAQHAWLWRFHAVHHSVRDLNGVNSFHHVSEAFFNMLIITIPLSLVTVDYGEKPGIVSFLIWFQVVFIHSPSRVNFGFMRILLADNRFHRIHHSLEPQHFDKNFAINFTIWDRLFGTVHNPGPDEWPAVGLAQIDQPRSLRQWLDLPLRYREAADMPEADQVFPASPARMTKESARFTPIT